MGRRSQKGLPTFTVQLFAEVTDETEKPTFYVRLFNETNYFTCDYRALYDYYVRSKADDIWPTLVI